MDTIVENPVEIDRQAVADKRAQAASLEMQARRLHREADEIERNLIASTISVTLSPPFAKVPLFSITSNEKWRR